MGEGFYSDKSYNLKIKKYETGLVKKPRPKNLDLLGFKNNLTLSPCEQREQGGSKFNVKKKSTYPQSAQN